MRKTRNILTIILCTLVLCICLGGAYAEGLLSVTVSTETGTTDDIVNVYVRIENGRDLEAIQFSVNYNPDVLELVSATAGSLLQNGITEQNDFNDGVVHFAYACGSGLTEESGELLKLSFKLLSDEGSAVTVSDCLAWNYNATEGETKTYITLQNGGVASAATGVVPQSLTATWTPETPTPVPTDTPRPTNGFSAMADSDPTGYRNILKFGILLVVLFLILLVVLWIVLKAKDRRNRF